MQPIHYVTRHANGDLIAYDQAGQIVSKISESGLLKVATLYPDLVVTVEPGLGAAPPMAKQQLSAVATANVDLLFFPRTIDAIGLEVGDYILLVGQKDERKNGIWRAGGYETGRLSAMKMPTGETPFRVYVKGGLVNASTTWEWTGKTWVKVF